MGEGKDARQTCGGEGGESGWVVTLASPQLPITRHNEVTVQLPGRRTEATLLPRPVPQAREGRASLQEGREGGGLTSGGYRQVMAAAAPQQHLPHW